jgi:phospholipase C
MPPIEHVFVLMLENRSFDHLLGFSGITGTDAATGAPPTVNGLASTMSNSWKGSTYRVSTPALDPMKADPYHEFTDVLEQLCGNGAQYPKGGRTRLSTTADLCPTSRKKRFRISRPAAQLPAM